MSACYNPVNPYTALCTFSTATLTCVIFETHCYTLEPSTRIMHATYSFTPNPNMSRGDVRDREAVMEIGQRYLVINEIR